ncbi:signal peptidase II [Rugosimonospora acidiphila]|uniref:Lipoprotein signal peptidase n=1 Tax=Rugosimonospora acidiphila TaxID=556531 RepID=A0ABP9SKH5_9ACTN
MIDGASVPGEGAPVADEAAPAAVAPSRLRVAAIGVLGATMVFVVAIDLLTKYLVTANLTGHPPVKVLGGFFYLDEIRNSGAAFSMGTSHTWVFPLVTVVVVCWIGWLARRLRSIPWGIGLGLVLGGALGNLGDRVFRAPGFLEGHVVDFVSLFGPNGAHWPIFNLADASLCCGVVLAVLLELFGRRRDGGRVRGTEQRGEH